MTLTKMVAQLNAGPDSNPSLSQGSAWFIDGQHALTALHCVQSEDGCYYKNISLKFSDSTERIAVEIHESDPKLDVALLKTKGPLHANFSTIPVLALARNVGSRDDSILMHGHPAQSLTAIPSGVSVTGKIHDPCLLFNGAKGNLDCNVIQCSNIDVPSVDGSNKLQGISGGPVFFDQSEADVAVLGLVIEEGLNGGFIHVVPITAIAEKFSQVRIALENSKHVNTHDHRICISLLKDGETLEWSAGISPKETGQLWQNSNLGKYALHSHVKLSQLGAAAKALTRLAIYSGIKSIHAPDKETWEKRLNDASNFSKHPRPELHTVAALGTLPATGQNITTKELAETIHAALNKELLDFLNDKLFACLDGNDTDYFESAIELQLRNAMWEIWTPWYPLLSNNPNLLTSFLIRIFSLDADAAITHDALLAIGSCDGVKRQLLHATMFVLAIAAAGISAQPHEHEFGNFAVDNRTGHSSGVEYNNRKRISMLVASHNWKTEVIFLPFLHNQLLVEASKAVALTKPNGTMGCLQKNNFPVAITADNDFLTALEAGVCAVLEYYNARVNEVQLQINAMKSPTRTEALDA